MWMGLPWPGQPATAASLTFAARRCCCANTAASAPRYATLRSCYCATPSCAMLATAPCCCYCVPCDSAVWFDRLPHANFCLHSGCTVVLYFFLPPAHTVCSILATRPRGGHRLDGPVDGLVPLCPVILPVLRSAPAIPVRRLCRHPTGCGPGGRLLARLFVVATVTLLLVVVGRCQALRWLGTVPLRRAYARFTLTHARAVAVALLLIGYGLSGCRVVVRLRPLRAVRGPVPGPDSGHSSLELQPRLLSLVAVGMVRCVARRHVGLP